MRRLASVKKRVASLLIAGGLSLGALAGTTGVAHAATFVCYETTRTCYEITGYGSTYSAAISNAYDRATAFCGSRRVIDQNQAIGQQQKDGSYTYTIYIACA
ncbi:hypothetical protein [Streptomyces sp. NPDC057623]|uniref:hypothetical protein n=1 Tax=Streptomyces sp. NPDC057623 TaxID=3346187 RepID=UPI003678E923